MPNMPRHAPLRQMRRDRAHYHMSEARRSLTPKQDAFARYIAAGESYSAAYAKAYDAARMSRGSIHSEASKLMAQDRITRRVAELQNRSGREAAYSVQDALGELEELRALALAQGQYSTAISAVEKKAKLHGLFEKDNIARAPIAPSFVRLVGPKDFEAKHDDNRDRASAEAD